MDHMNKTIVPTSLDNTRGSNYGHWSILIILVIFLGIFIVWFFYTYGLSTFQQNTNATLPTTNPIPSNSPTELYKTSSDISDNNIIVNDNDNDINNALESSPQSNSLPNADDSYSNIQLSKPTNKSGWCYIGEERGFRSCIEVGDNDLCMSGNIFPSQEICINPSLR